MKPIPTHPDLPEPTNTFGRPVAKSQWYECPHCKQLSPLQREWIELTDEEIVRAANICGGDPMKEFARAIEAKLKEKNT